MRSAVMWLNRPGTRWAYSVIMSMVAMWRRREPWWIRYRDDRWIHRTRRGAIPWPTAHAPHPSLWDHETVDYFCWDFVPDAGDTVVDVGAGIGTEVPTWSRLVGPGGRVVAIEAHPGSYERLVALIELNGYPVDPVHAAVTDRAGTVRISDAPNADLNTIMGSEAGFEVAASTLDEVLAATGVERIDLLKMNIEGAERLAIEGMAKMIKSTKHAVIACHDFLGKPDPESELRTRDQVRAFLVENGFTVRQRSGDGRPWVEDYLYATTADVE